MWPSCYQQKQGVREMGEVAATLECAHHSPLITAMCIFVWLDCGRLVSLQCGRYTPIWRLSQIDMLPGRGNKEAIDHKLLQQHMLASWQACNQNTTVLLEGQPPVQPHTCCSTLVRQSQSVQVSITTGHCSKWASSTRNGEPETHRVYEQCPCTRGGLHGSGSACQSCPSTWPPLKFQVMFGPCRDTYF